MLDEINILSRNFRRKARVSDLIDVKWYTVGDIKDNTLFFNTEDPCYDPNTHTTYTLKEVYDMVTKLGYVLCRNQSILMVSEKPN